jgi:hypothetical protein
MPEILRVVASFRLFRSIPRGVTDAKESSGSVACLRKHGRMGGMWNDNQQVYVRGNSRLE